jgi:protein involved in sex pheromone biosynthesis
MRRRSNSDHSITKYAIGPDNRQNYNAKTQEERFTVNKESIAKYHANFTKIVEINICKPHNDDINDLDDKLYKLISRDTGIEKQIDDFSRVLRTACKTSFKIHRAPKT